MTINFQKIFTLNPHVIVDIKRIFSRSYLQDFALIPINNSAYYSFARNTYIEEPLMLPKLYAAFTYLTGPGDDFYDDYKGSFSFTFELSVQKNNNTTRHLYHVYHYRSYIEFSVCVIAPTTDPRDDRVLHEPDDELFSDEDICYFSNYFCFYAIEFIKSVKYAPKPFIKHSDSNLLIFGYKENDYFLEQHEDYDEYHKEKKMLLEKYNSNR